MKTDWNSLPNVKRLADEIDTHPAADRLNVLATRHSSKTEIDVAAMKAMFPHLRRQTKA